MELTILQKTVYICDKCKHKSYKESTYLKHECDYKFKCDICQFNTNNSGVYKEHLSTKKHNTLINSNIKIDNLNNEYNYCNICCIYVKYLYHHEKSKKHINALNTSLNEEHKQ